jgi:hypothetical protein
MLEPNTIYHVWLPYRNAPDNRSGEVTGDVVFAPDIPGKIDGIHWVSIGKVDTDADGNVHYFNRDD